MKKKSVIFKTMLLLFLVLCFGMYMLKAQETEKYPFLHKPCVNHGESVKSGQQPLLNDSYSEDFRTELPGRYADGVAISAAIQGDIAFISQGCVIRIVDISDFDNIEEIQNFILPSPAIEVKVVDNNLMLGVFAVGLMIYDVSDLSAPFLKGVYNLWEQYGNTLDLDVENDIAYLGGAYGVISLDVSNPSNIGFVHHVYDSAAVYTLAAKNGVVYFDCYSQYSYKGYMGTMEVWSIQLNSLSMGFGINSFEEYIFYGRRRGLTAYSTVTQQANTVYFASSENVMDVSDPVGDYLVVGTLMTTAPSVASIKLIDISDPDQMIILGEFEIEGETFNHVNLYEDQSQYIAILPAYQNGIRFLEVDDTGVSELGYTPAGDQYAHITIIDDQYFYSTNMFSMELFAVNLPSIIHLNDWWFGNYPKDIITHNYPDNPHLYLQVTPPDEFPGLKVIDASDIYNPVELCFTPHVSCHNTMLMTENYLYALSGSLKIVDITEIPPEVTGNLQLPPGGGLDMAFHTEIDHLIYATIYNKLLLLNVMNPEEPEIIYEISGQASYSQVEADDNYLYVTGDGYFAVYDVTNLLPEEIALYELPLYHGKKLAVEGDFAYLGNVYYGISVLDISDPGSITHHSSAYTGGTVTDIEIGDYLYVSDYACGIYLFEKGGATSITAGNELQNEIIVDQNFPNPFRSVTNISYYLPAKSQLGQAKTKQGLAIIEVYNRFWLIQVVRQNF